MSHCCATIYRDERTDAIPERLLTRPNGTVTPELALPIGLPARECLDRISELPAMILCGRRAQCRVVALPSAV